MALRLFVIAVGGALGALARYALSDWFVRRFPAGTLVVNIVGCLLIGAVMGLCRDRAWLSDNLRLFFVTGFLGALTTFSTFGWQTFALSERGDLWLATINVIIHLIAGFTAVAAGFQAGLGVAAWLGPPGDG